MSASKRPSTSSLRRFITSRPYVTVAELRRRFGLDDPDAMAHVNRNGTSAWIGLPEREATKLQDLWQRDELGVELSVEVRAPVVVGFYPMRIARYVTDAHPGANGHTNGFVHSPQKEDRESSGRSIRSGDRTNTVERGSWIASSQMPTSQAATPAPPRAD
jgi:hypothetical protein